MTDSDCLFCKIIIGQIPSFKVDEDALTYAFMDINPATPGHLLVVPKQHSADITEVSVTDLAAVAATAQRLAVRVKERLGAHGVNLLNSCGVAAWQTVFHFHVHVIPRYADDPSRDPLVLPWQPAPGDMSAISATADLLRA